MKINYKFSLTPPAPPRAEGVIATDLPFEVPTDYWSIPPFGMLAFPGFACVSAESPATFTHPAGHVARITVRVLNGQPTQDQVQEAVNFARSQAEEIRQSIEKDFGPAQVQSEEFTLAGLRLVAVRADRRDFSGDRFFLLYAAIAEKGHMALVTVEGPGSAESMAKTVEPILKACHFAA